MSFRIQPQMFHPFLPAIPYYCTVHSCSVWEGVARLTGGSSWKLVATASLSMVPCSKEAPVSRPKALKSNWTLYQSFQETRKKKLLCRVTSKSSKVPLHLFSQRHTATALQNLSSSILVQIFTSLSTPPRLSCIDQVDLSQFSVLLFTLKPQVGSQRHS